MPHDGASLTRHTPDAPGHEPVQYRVIGMDCAHDAAELERAARAAAGVASVKVSVATGILTARVADAAALERAVTSLGYGLAPVTPVAPADDVAPAYRRALWAVVALNLGYGLVEAAGGLVSGSRALRADALDFAGDGLLTCLALRAARRPVAWRARAALLQGLFLGALGLGVLASTAYRVLVRRPPEAELMGAFGAGALVANLLAAAVLLPHRAGDTGARAVWLFSRNDALGNVAVVAAAGLVAWTGTPWPDLAVAALVAGLFLPSAWAIVRDARADLREAAPPGRLR